ncbi:hypothetical protein CEXT_743551 [Caerostris extrusa]|uniref:Uncharacterized protein n=1 Tax=Caerostris extrusa TaxID=172846 RepID=A0AAV4MCB5_CAEEX|nr:hypothetical protein CEXT_743551 [Caerostris extrusa]
MTLTMEKQKLNGKFKDITRPQTNDSQRLLITNLQDTSIMDSASNSRHPTSRRFLERQPTGALVSQPLRIGKRCIHGNRRPRWPDAGAVMSWTSHLG